jgi:glycosyltransferase involved in cell wall biosynthesis
MKILLVFPFVPYPPTDGGRIGFFNPIKYLSRTHDVAIVSLASANEDEAIAGLRRVCGDVSIFLRSTRLDSYRLVRSVAVGLPGTTSKYWYPAAGELIRQTIRSHRPDIVEFHHLNTAAYRRFVGATPTILREHNVEYKVWERYAANSSSWLEKVFAKRIAARVKRYEARIAAKFDRCVVVSENDAAHLRGALSGARIEVIASGVDTEYFRPIAEIAEEPWTIALTGSFNWRPKQQSLRRLLTLVFPAIRAKRPEAKLVVVGKGVPDEILRLGRQIGGVCITGEVSDVRPYIAKASLLINYVESGGGIALKVLEAMAMRKPVLCNSLGCEGIPLQDGRDFSVADGPKNFAESAILLLENRAIRDRIATQGFQRVAERYSWNVVARQFGQCYQTLIDERDDAAQNEGPHAAYAC